MMPKRTEPILVTDDKHGQHHSKEELEKTMM